MTKKFFEHNPEVKFKAKRLYELADALDEAIKKIDNISIIPPAELKLLDTYRHMARSGSTIAQRELDLIPNISSDIKTKLITLSAYARFLDVPT